MTQSCQNLNHTTWAWHGVKWLYLYKFSTRKLRAIPKFVLDMWDSIHRLSSKSVMVLQGHFQKLELTWNDLNGTSWNQMPLRGSFYWWNWLKSQGLRLTRRALRIFIWWSGTDRWPVRAKSAILFRPTWNALTHCSLCNHPIQ